MHSKITVSSNKNEIKMNHVTNVLKIYPFDTAMTTHKTHNTDFTIRYVLICVKQAWQIITYIQFYELMFTESSQRITKCVVLQLAVFKQFIANNSILNLTSLYRLNTTICNVTQAKSRVSQVQLKKMVKYQKVKMDNPHLYISCTAIHVTYSKLHLISIEVSKAWV